MDVRRVPLEPKQNVRIHLPVIKVSCQHQYSQVRRALGGLEVLIILDQLLFSWISCLSQNPPFFRRISFPSGSKIILLKRLFGAQILIRLFTDPPLTCVMLGFYGGEGGI